MDRTQHGQKIGRFWSQSLARRGLSPGSGVGASSLVWPLKIQRLVFKVSIFRGVLIAAWTNNHANQALAQVVSAWRTCSKAIRQRRFRRRKVSDSPSVSELRIQDACIFSTVNRKNFISADIHKPDCRISIILLSQERLASRPLGALITIKWLTRKSSIKEYIMSHWCLP